MEMLQVQLMNVLRSKRHEVCVGVAINVFTIYYPLYTCKSSQLILVMGYEYCSSVVM